MRTTTLAVTMFGLCLVAVAGAALAQPQAQPPVPATAAPAQTLPSVNVFASSAEVQALIANARKMHPAGQPNFNQRLLSLAPYATNLEHRTATGPASTHEKNAELFYVVEGAATLITGGTLIGEKRTNPANLSGTGIAGGESRPFAKGDVFIVPQNTPHQVKDPKDGEVILISLHIPRG